MSLRLDELDLQRNLRRRVSVQIARIDSLLPTLSLDIADATVCFESADPCLVLSCEQRRA